MSHITRPVIDPIMFIEEDHDRIAEIFKEIQGIPDDSLAAKRAVFALLDEALMDHMQIEEELLYPRLEQLSETHDQTEESEEEHHVAKVLLEELSTIDIQSDDWDAKCTVLKENIQHHVEEEENSLLPQASQLMKREELLSLAEQIEDWLSQKER